MKGRRSRAQMTCRLPTLLGVAACFAVAAPPAFAGEGPPVSLGQTQTGPEMRGSQPSGETPAAVPDGAAGMRVYIDPRTGAVLPGPAPGSLPLQVTPQEQNAYSTSHQGLVQVPSPAPGGGVKLDLQGRFQSPLIGTVDADGKLKMQHLHEMPSSHDHK